jgi:hypothetical protein
LAEYKKAIKADSELKKVPLDPRVIDRDVCIGIEMDQEEQAKLVAFLDKNSDIFHGQPPTLWESAEMLLNTGYR